MKLAPKLIIGIIVLLGISLGFLTILSISSIKNALEEKIGQSQLQLTKQILDEIDRTLYGGVQDIRVISEAEDFEEFLVNGNIGESVNTLDEFTFLTGPWDRLVVMTPDALTLLSTDGESGKGSVLMEAHEATIQRGEVFVSDLLISPVTGKPTVIFAAPIFDESVSGRKIVGMVRGEFAWQVIIEILEESESDDTTLLNKNGVVIGEGRRQDRDLKEEYLTQNNVLDIIDFEKEGEHAEIHDLGIDIQEEVLSSIVEQKGHLSYLGNEWVLVLDTKIDTAFTDVNNLVRKLLLGTFIVLLIVIALSFFFARSISKSLNTLTKGAEIIGKGNLKHRIDVKSKDEIGELATAFNNMAVNLAASKDKLREQIRVKEQVKRLKELDRFKTQFLSITTHELRTPVTPIKIQIGLLLESYFGKITEKQKKSLTMILRNTLRLDSLIADILDISKIQGGKLKFVLEKTDFAYCIKNSIESVIIFANEKNIALTTKIAKLPKFNSDRNRLIQVITNLLYNAVKFTPENGKIIIEAEKQKDKILVKVKDTGVGIEGKNLKKIFEPFLQAKSSYKLKDKGTGLGLAICKGIIEHLGGKIWVKSEVGKGSTFYFTLPLNVNRLKTREKLK